MKRIGTTGINNEGEKYEILDKKNFKDKNGFNYLLRFTKSGQYQWVNFTRVKNGNFKDFSKPFIFSVGYAKGTQEKPFYRGGESHIFEKWEDMIKRCYRNGGERSYENVSVCKSWHNYANFKEWYLSNDVTKNGFAMCLDKDLFAKKDKKVYSPQTCCLLTPSINSLLVNVDFEVFNERMLNNIHSLQKATTKAGKTLHQRVRAEINYRVNKYFNDFEEYTGTKVEDFTDFDLSSVKVVAFVEYEGKIYKFLNLQELKKFADKEVEKSLKKIKYFGG